jgi:small ligand-binding sensory domain FIST
MPFAAALSTAADTRRAVDQVCSQAHTAFADQPDLAVIFLSPHHADESELIVAGVQERLRPRFLLGCTGESIVGNDQEVENEHAVSLWLGRWSKPVQFDPFHLTLGQTPDGYSLFGWPDALLNADPERSVMLLLGEPHTFPADGFLQQINQEHPGLRVVGGMASALGAPGQNRLLLGTEVHSQGAVGVLMQGPVTVRTIVSQGCRPIGEHMIVTRGQRNIILELGGQTPLARLQHLWPELSERDQQLVRQGLHVGRVINEYKGQFQRGDFLIRNVMGLDKDSGAIAITDHVRVGQTVQFHVRDADAADEDLHDLLQSDVTAHERPPKGALLFTCNGRGTRLFSSPHHDARTIQAETGGVPLAGLFAAGELGPVGGQNFIHGFTASVALFEDE